jgi:dTDP-4-dehydrorhamnose reductase
MIWVIGDRGMLGSELRERLNRSGIEYIGTDRELDITDNAAISAFASGKRIRWVVNCAAYTAVEKAEDEPLLCRRLNAYGAGNIASVAASIDAKMVQISTDYVFDGSARRPYLEDDPVNPIGTYGRTKAEGELLVLRNCPGSFIIRTAWLYGKHGGNFIYTMLKLMKDRESINVVADQRGSPTWASDLTDAIIRIIESESDKYGIYHYTDEGDISWFDFAVAIRGLAKSSGILTKNCAINPITTEEFPAKVRRPAYSVLSKKKIREVFGISVPDWLSSLRAFMEAEAIG